MTATAAKPTYLGMLNSIAVAETRAYVYLNAWADVTTDPAVKAILRTVALREGEHGMSFARRVNELGFDVVPGDDSEFKRTLETVKSGLSDREKIEAVGLLKYCVEDGPDVFENLFRDHTIDIQTGALLGRYIAEERDTLRMVKGCYDQLCAAEAAANTNGAMANGAPAAAQQQASSAVDARLSALEAKVDAVCQAIDALRRVVVPETISA